MLIPTVQQALIEKLQPVFQFPHPLSSSHLLVTSPSLLQGDCVIYLSAPRGARNTPRLGLDRTMGILLEYHVNTTGMLGAGQGQGVLPIRQPLSYRILNRRYAVCISMVHHSGPLRNRQGRTGHIPDLFWHIPDVQVHI